MEFAQIFIFYNWNFFFKFLSRIGRYIQYWLSMMSQGKTPSKNSQGEFRGIWGVFPRHLSPGKTQSYEIAIKRPLKPFPGAPLTIHGVGLNDSPNSVWSNFCSRNENCRILSIFCKIKTNRIFGFWVLGYRECVREGARTRRSLEHHLFHPLILRLVVLYAPAVLRPRALQDAPAPADPNS